MYFFSDKIKMCIRDRMDTDTPIANAYTYTDRTERAEEKKKIPPVEQVIDYLNKNYAFRRNTVLDRLEMCDLSKTKEGKSFYAMRNKDLNSIFLNISRQGIVYPLNSLKSVCLLYTSPSGCEVRTHRKRITGWWERKRHRPNGEWHVYEPCAHSAYRKASSAKK